MVVLIFGITNVGKTAIGKKLAEKLDYSFVDLDEEIKKTFHTTLENFMKENPWPHERYIVKGNVLKRIIEDHKENNTIIAVSPIYEARNFNSLLTKEYIMAVELQDTEEHIFERLVFPDWNIGRENSLKKIDDIMAL